MDKTKKIEIDNDVDSVNNINDINIDKDSKITFSVDYFNILKEDDQIMILEGHIVSEGRNRKPVYFPLDAINKAYFSVFNKPVLCVYDGFDFKEHARNDMDVRNLQRIGTVPESTNGEIVVKDDKKWQKIDIIIWKQYNKSIIKKLINNENNNGKTKLSVEIDVKKYHRREDGLLSIDEYIYTAICLLGDRYNEGIPGASVNISKYSDSDNIDEGLEDSNLDKNLNKMYFAYQNSKGKEEHVLKTKKEQLEFLLLENKYTFSKFDDEYVYCTSEDNKECKFSYSCENEKYTINYACDDKTYVADKTDDNKNDKVNDKSDDKSDKEDSEKNADVKDDKSDDKKDNKYSSEQFSISEIKALVSENEQLKNENTDLSEKVKKYEFSEKKHKIDLLFSENKEYLTDSDIKGLEENIVKFSYNEIEAEMNKIIVSKMKTKLLNTKTEKTNTVDVSMYSFVKKNINNTDDTDNDINSISGYINNKK